MDLNAITNPRASGKLLLFKDTRPVAEAIAKGLRAAIPVQPVSPGAQTQAAASGNLATVLKTMTAEIEAMAAAIRGPAPPTQKAGSAPRPAPNPVQRSTGNPPSVPLLTETQRCRAAESREQARRAAAQADADRVLVQKSGSRVLTFRKLDPTLSDAAVQALSHIVATWEANEKRPVRVYAADLARALDLPLATAQAAFTELVDGHLIISAANSLGVVQVQPGIGVTGA